MKNTSGYFPDLGFGLGLRPRHYPHIFERQPEVGWFEIISENFMDTDGRPRRNLARIAEHYPLVMHGVAMSIGSSDPMNFEYLTKLKKLADDIKPALISDHLCWTGIANKNTHDLLPVPYTEEALKYIVQRIRAVQDFLGRPIALENPSTYLEFKTSQISESEFIAEMSRQSGCYLLLDVNNVYVTCYNHRLCPKAYIDALPLDKVSQIHLSGHSNKGTHIIDTHDDHVVDDVWRLYKYVVHKAGRTPNTMVEWDDNIPEFDVLFAELEKAKIAAKDARNFAPLPDLARQVTPYITNIPMPLAGAQAHMQEAILRGADSDSSPDTWIRAKEKFAAAEQLAVYVNAYRFRLFDVTAEDFPALKHFLGDDDFNRLINDFVNSVQSSHFNIGRYAASLPDFLKVQGAGGDFAVELAALENTICQIADRQETTPLEPKHLEGMTAEKLMVSVLYPRKALQLFAFNYPVNAYFRAVMDEQSPLPPAPEKTHLAVFRHDDIVWRMDLEEAEYALLGALFAGKTIGEALGAIDESAAVNISEYFARWMRNGLLAFYELTDKQTKRGVA